MQEKLLQQVLAADQIAANIQAPSSKSNAISVGHQHQIYDNNNYQGHTITSSNGHNTNEAVYSNIIPNNYAQLNNVISQLPETSTRHGPTTKTMEKNQVLTIDNVPSNTTNQNEAKSDSSVTSSLQQEFPQPHYWSSNQLFLTPTHFHAQENARVPSPLNMTYLTPSRQNPIVTAFQTPPMYRNRQFKNKRLVSPSDGETDKSGDEDEIDVVNDARSQSTDSGKDSDVSMLSVQSAKSTSPSGSSTKSNSPVGSTKSCSPTGSSNDGSPASSVTSPSEQPARKKARTNYSPSQVQALEKVFHENPYPDSEKMESLSNDLEIPEGKIKVWFQNKRARWRRRVQENTHMAPYYTPMSPMMTPMSPYGFMNGMFCASPSPAHVAPNNLMYPSTPTSASSTTNTQNSPQQSPTMTSPYQSRGQIHPPYFPMYPYGMFPPYYCS